MPPGVVRMSFKISILIKFIYKKKILALWESKNLSCHRELTLNMRFLDPLPVLQEKSL